MKIHFTLPGIPFAKQSTRMTKKGFTYTDPKVKAKQTSMHWDLYSQLPQGFKPFTDAIIVKKLLFVFPFLKEHKQDLRDQVNSGRIVLFKTTKPDLTDNLNKALFDAMQGVVFINDSQVCRIEHSMKIYGDRPRIEILIEEVSNTCELGLGRREI